MNPLFTLLLASAANAEAPPTTPAVGTITPYTLDIASDVASYSFAHTRAAGAALQAIIFYRSNGSPSPTVSGVDFAGTPLAARGQDKVDGAGRIGCASFTLDSGVGPEGAQTVTITLSAARARDAVAWAVDILDSAGAQQGVADAIEDAGATTVAIGITPANAASLLVGAAGCIDGSGTISAGSGWTSQGTAESATDSVAVEARLQSKAPNAVTAQTIDAGFSASRIHRAACGVEWLPS